MKELLEILRPGDVVFVAGAVRAAEGKPNERTVVIGDYEWPPGALEIAGVRWKYQPGDTVIFRRRVGSQNGQFTGEVVAESDPSVQAKFYQVRVQRPENRGTVEVTVREQDMVRRLNP